MLSKEDNELLCDESASEGALGVSGEAHPRIQGAASEAANLEPRLPWSIS